MKENEKCNCSKGVRMSTWFVVVITTITITIICYSVFLIYKNGNFISSPAPQPTATVTVTSTPTQSSSAIPDATVGWKVYNNDVYGLSFKYPIKTDNSYVINLQQNDHPAVNGKVMEFVNILYGQDIGPDGGRSLMADEEKISFSFLKENTNTKTVKEFARQDVADSKILSENEITISNIIGYQIKIYGEMGGNIVQIYLPIPNGYLLITNYESEKYLSGVLSTIQIVK